MTAWLVLGAFLLLGSLLFAKLFLSADPRILAQIVRYLAGSILILLSLLFFARGGFLFGLPCLVLGLAVMSRHLPSGLNPFRSSGGLGRERGRARRTSSINTATLRMTLDHESGEMDGEVLAGPFTSQVLSAMSIEDLLRLFEMCCRDDPDAAQLLEVYLQRQRSDELGENWTPGHESTARDDGPPGRIGRDEAFAVLGLEPGASREEILRAYKKLMKKFHPDQGGSNYLASKINEAKDLLIGE